jgi:5-methylcytosine-specific restriction endonuclease McrA
MNNHRRHSRELWAQIRAAVWARDEGYCGGPYCADAPPLPLEVAHIDHIVPLSKGGSNHMDNLRTLCRRCHVLRAGHEHQGMIAAALRDGVIPPDWRPLVWDG